MIVRTPAALRREKRVYGRRLMILQLAGFLPRGTLGHGYSLVTVRQDEERENRLCERGPGEPEGSLPLLFWNGDAIRCTNPSPPPRISRLN